MTERTEGIVADQEHLSQESIARQMSEASEADQQRQPQLDVTQKYSPNPSFMKRLLAPLFYLGEVRSRTARLLNIILIILIAATILVYFTMVIASNPTAIFVTASIMLLIEVTSFVLLRLGQVRASSITLSLGLWLILVFISMNTGGMSNVPFIALLLMVTIAVLLLGGVAGFIYAMFNFVIGLVLLIMGINGLPLTQMIPLNLTSFWFSMNVIFLASAGLIYMANKGIEEAVQVARDNERTQAAISRELFSVRASLEQQVSQRTQELQKRTDYLQASIEVSQATSSILDPEQLMQAAVNLIHEQFNLYYVGLFLLDPSGDWATLRSAAGETNQAMLEGGDRIPIESGMVGRSIANAQPQVALDAAKQSISLAMPELPKAPSEAAIPLRSRGNVLGALALQSEQPRAFGEMEISVLQALADQFAIALDNAGLLQESQKALEEARIAYGKVSQQAWEDLLSRGYDLGYRYDQRAITRLQHEPDSNSQWQSEINQVMESAERLKVDFEGGSALFLPVLVRDQVIGVINFIKEKPAQSAGHETQWSEEEIGLLETIIGELGIALDSARLYQDTQRLAFREQLTGEITSRIRETLDIETVLRTAAQEIQKSLGLPEVVISLGLPESNNA